MSSKPLLLVVATLIAANTAYAGCDLPKPPHHIPNGNKATQEEMVSAQKEVQDYNTKTTEYTECIQRELDEALAKKGPEVTDKEKKAMASKAVEKQNAAVDKVQSVADRFNEQVRVYKARTATTDDTKKNGS